MKNYVYKVIYLLGNKQKKAYVIASSMIEAINRLFDTEYKDARAYDHFGLLHISLLKKGA